MKLQNSGFRYHDEKSRETLITAIENLRACCGGYNLRIIDLIGDINGLYDDNNLRNFIDDLIASYPSALHELNSEKIDYIKTLLYISIRACQANLQAIKIPPHWSNNRTSLATIINSDTISDLKHEISKSIFFYNSEPSADGNPSKFISEFPQYGPISDDLATTAASLYYFLTDTYILFPSPYQSSDTLATNKFGSLNDACKAIETEELSGYDIDDNLINLLSDLDREKSIELSNSISDKNSESEYANDIQKEFEYAQSAKKRCIFDSSTDEENRIKNEEQLRLKFEFENKDSFIEMYEHLVEITNESFQNLERYIQIMFDKYLENNNLTIYKYPEAYATILDYIYRAIDVVKNNQKG